MSVVNNEPLFSIIVPVYNTQDYLIDCIESVLNQTFSDYELILVDDGSTDNSGLICDQYAKMHTQIHVHHIPNQGSLCARCHGIDKSKGTFLIFLDSDDLLYPFAINTIYDSFCESYCDMVIFGWERLVNGNRIDFFQPVQSKLLFNDKSSLGLKILCNHDFNSLCIKSMKKTLFHNIDYSSFYSIQRGEDLLQTLELINNAHCVAMIPDILYMYRMNESSITNKQDYDTDYSIRDTVSAFVENDLHFSSEDSCKYYSHCANDLINNAIHVIRSDLSVEKQNALFALYKSSETYKMTITRYSAKLLGWRCILMFSFSKNAYWFIRFFVSIYSLIKHN